MEFIGHILTVLVVQPIFNLLVFITAILPGHNLGLAIIIFTVLVRILLWPLVKKQLHHTRAMQQLQPDLKKIKQAAAGDRQKESKLMMELYKEKGINPFSSIGIVLLQLPIFIALYLSVRKIADNPQEIINFSYSWLHSLGWVKDLIGNINQLDNTLVGIVDLTKHATAGGSLYWPAVIISAAAGLTQYFQSKQLLPQSPQKRSIKDILGDASKGKSADQAELNAAVGRSTIVLIPFMVFLFGLGFPAALPLYWLVNSGVAYFQQAKVLNRDQTELEIQASTPGPETKEPNPKSLKRKNKKHSSKNKRRRRR